TFHASARRTEEVMVLQPTPVSTMMLLRACTRVRTSISMVSAGFPRLSRRQTSTDRHFSSRKK
ncbi:unnamed protein product, partial [Musa banksii]